MRITVCVCVQRGQFSDSITPQPELEVLVNTHSHMHTTHVYLDWKQPLLCSPLVHEIINWWRHSVSLEGGTWSGCRERNNTAKGRSCKHTDHIALYQGVVRQEGTCIPHLDTSSQIMQRGLHCTMRHISKLKSRLDAIQDHPLCSMPI